MPAFLVSYELTKPKYHNDFLEQSLAFGWSPWLDCGQSGLFRLPNSTLSGTFADLDTAIDTWKRAIHAMSRDFGGKVVLSKWIVTECPDGRLSSDDLQPALGSDK